jgi:hypothetical protein
MNKLYYKKFCLIVKDMEIIKKKNDLYIEFFDNCFSNLIDKKKNEIIEQQKQKQKQNAQHQHTKQSNSSPNKPTVNESNNDINKSEDEDIVIEDIVIEENPMNDFKNKLKKLISLKSHPDKVKGKEELFRKAMKACDEDDLYELIYVAGVLGVTIPDNMSNSIYKDSIQKLESKKNNIFNTYAWVWFEYPKQRNMLRLKLANLWGVSVNDVINAEKEFEK